MSKKEFIKRYVSRESKMFKIMFALRIAKIKITGEPIMGRKNDYPYKIRHLNPYNPLSYIIVILMIIPVVIKFFIKELMPEITSAFKYK